MWTICPSLLPCSNMALSKRNPTSAEALTVISSVALASFILATLFVAREILIPIALAALLTFMVAPLVTRLERWIGRITAVLAVVAMIFAGMGLAGWVLTKQLIDFATRLPDYKENIVTKIRTFRVPENRALSAISKTVEELKKELPGGEKANGAEAEQPIPKSGTGEELPIQEQAKVTPVQVVDGPGADPMATLQAVLAEVLGPLGNAALVLLLVIFMLLQREDLRNRIIRLVGQGRISATTRAMDDAGKRVARYLLMQLAINVMYGAAIAAGLFFIGVPNAALWGAFGTILRFIPYVGPWLAAILPTAVSLAVSPHWTMPLMTIALFAVAELIVNNILEPLLYGRNTGVSSIALIIAAVFWTWLWGPVGLVLATPLTVCMVVMGRHVPRLAFLSILLSDEEPLTPTEDCYHRLLTPHENDELEFVENYLKGSSVASLYGTVFVPILTTAETELREQGITHDQFDQLTVSMSDIVEDLTTRPMLAAESATEGTVTQSPSLPPCRVCVLSAKAVRDEVAGSMLAHLLNRQGFEVWKSSAKVLTGEIIALVEKNRADVACISVVAPSTVLHARYICMKLRAQFPRLRIVVGMWQNAEALPHSAIRLREAGADQTVSTFEDAVSHIRRLRVEIADAAAASDMPAQETAPRSLNAPVGADAA